MAVEVRFRWPVTRVTIVPRSSDGRPNLRGAFRWDQATLDDVAVIATAPLCFHRVLLACHAC